MMQLLDHVVIRNAAESGDVYSGTALTTYRDGDTEVLLCAFRVGTSKVGRDGRIVLYESRDGGRAWARVPSPLDADHAEALAPAGGDLQLAGPHLGSDGTTVILAACRMRVVEEGSPDFDAQAAGIVDAECVLVRFRDGVWETPVVIDGRRTPDEWAITCGPPLPLGGGRWLAPAERHAKAYQPEWLRGYHAFQLVSPDDGRTWEVDGAMLNDPERVVVYYDQHATVVDGPILSLAWVHDVVDDVTLDARAGWSEDGGQTWSAPFETHLPGGPLASVHLGNGLVVASYPHRRPPAGVRLCVSRDGGATWDVGAQFVVWDEATRSVTGRPADEVLPGGRPDALWDTMWGWSFGLPTIAALADGTLGVAYYATDAAGTPQVSFARVAVASAPKPALDPVP